MADIPQSDSDRAVSIEADQSWPEKVEIRLQWRLPSGRVMATTVEITADAYFGRGASGAPMNGNALFAQIDRLRREGPPNDKPPPFKREGRDQSKR